MTEPTVSLAQAIGEVVASFPAGIDVGTIVDRMIESAPPEVEKAIVLLYLKWEAEGEGRPGSLDRRAEAVWERTDAAERRVLLRKAMRPLVEEYIAQQVEGAPTFLPDGEQRHG